MKLSAFTYLATALFFLITCCPNTPYAAELVKVTRVNNKDIVQLFFNFDTPPRFSSNASKKRINLIFQDSKSNTSFKMFDPDEHIVKILSRQVDDKFIISLFFRYQPQYHKITQSTDNNIVFEVLLGNQYSKSYKNLAERLKGLTVVDRTTPDFTNPYTVTPYVKDWKSFFAEFESEIRIELPVKFTLLPFPIIALLPPGNKQNLSILTEEALTLASQNLWEQLSSLILDLIQNTDDINIQKMLALTYGEVLLRNGDFKGGFKQLYLLEQEYSHENLGTYANYLLILLRAIEEDPYIAEYEFRKLQSSIPNNSPLAPYFFLSQIESALASHEYKRLNKLLLRDDVALPRNIEERVKIRQADYWYAINQSVKAFAAYKLLENSKIIASQPYSYNGYCNTLYAQKKYDLSARCYKQLTALADDDQDTLGLISYRENMSKLKYRDRAELIDAFSQIENAFPRTEAGFLAEIKKNDLLLLQNMNWSTNGLENYINIADEASERSIKGEALLKAILIHTLADNNKVAVEKVMDLLRDFRTGKIRLPAQALLIDLLPGEIQRLVDEQKYMDALVLAKRNRLLFQNNWLDSGFLVNIAKAYHNIGIFDEAQKLYLYLIEISPVDRRETYYMPMIQATFDYGNFVLVEDYAAQYSYNYPKGQYRDEILYLRLQALVSDERLQDALLLLPTPLPDHVALKRLAARLYYRLGKNEKTAELFRTLSKTEELSQQELFIYAESLYRTDRFDEAEATYETISGDNPFYDQSIYRLAQLARRKGQEEKAYNLFKILAQEGKNQRWIKYAERELQYKNLKDLY